MGGEGKWGFLPNGWGPPPPPLSHHITHTIIAHSAQIVVGSGNIEK